MGFRAGAYATLWEVRPTKSDKVLSANVSISRKRQDGTFDDEFSQWVKLIGNAKKRGESITERTRIKILDCDVKAPYDKQERKTKFYDFVIFDFEDMNGNSSEKKSSSSGGTKQPAKRSAFEYEGDTDEEDVPF